MKGRWYLAMLAWFGYISAAFAVADVVTRLAHGRTQPWGFLLDEAVMVALFLFLAHADHTIRKLRAQGRWNAFIVDRSAWEITGPFADFDAADGHLRFLHDREPDVYTASRFFIVAAQKPAVQR